MRRLAAAASGLIVGGLLALIPVASGGASTPAAPAAPKAQQKHAEQSDVSAPLSSIPPARRIPRQTHGDSPMPTPSGPIVADPVVQSSPTASAAPVTSTNFDGVAANGSAPPDPNGAVGPNHYFDLANSELQIFDKSGVSKLGPEPTYTIWSGFGGECASENDGDGIVRYDALADRWVVSQFALGPSGNGPFYQCIAVSTTADPTGRYYRYAFGFANFPDYPKMGIWPDGYYQTMNMFDATNRFLGPATCAYDRDLLLTGQAGTAQCFQLSSIFGSMLPGDLDGVTPPPAGEANTQIALGTDNTHLASWRFHVDWAQPNNTTLAETNIPVAAYAGACNGGGTCIPQPGTTQRLDSLADRVMYRFAYRNLGGHESWVVTYSVAAGAGAAPRWFELRSTPPGGAISAAQDSTYAPDSTAYRWMGSAAMDSAGDMALGYSVSSSTIAPEIAYTGRLATDPLNTMGPETVLIAGPGVQTGSNLSRWGDYTAMNADPSDGCTFWYTNEYLPNNGAFNWHTRIGSFAFPTTACAPRTDSDFSMALFPASGSVPVSGGTATTTVSTGRTAGTAEPISLSASGMPAGVTASFSTPSVTAGASSTLTFTVASGSVAGTYPITVTGTAASGSHSSTYSLTITPPPSTTIVNGGFETGTLSSWTAAGTAAVSTSSVHGGAFSALVGSTSTATNGDSSISQTFQPAATATLSFWYRVVCPDTVTYDWATATLTDATTNTTTTLLGKTCTNSGMWVNVSSAIGSAVVGHTLTLTLTSHDDNYAADPTGTYFDDVTLTSAAPDFTLSATPASQSVAPGTNAAYQVNVGATNGFTGSVGLSVTGQPADATVSFSPPSVSGSGSSALTVTTGQTTGNFSLTITGTSGSLTHTTSVTLVVQAPSFTVTAAPTSRSVKRGGTTNFTVTVASNGGFSGTVALAASGSGATYTLSPASVFVPSGGSVTSTLTATAGQTSGTYPITITGTSGTLSSAAPVTLTVTRR